MKPILRISIFVLASLMLLAACGGVEATSYLSDEAIVLGLPADAPPPESPAEPVAPVPESEGIIYRTGSDLSVNIARTSDRLIIKDAEIKLLVEDSDVAIDRLTQLVSDVGGYIISSRVWYEDWGEEPYKYSSITIGVPADQFERSLRRLRDLALRVIDEKAMGEDVTDQFVDLQSRLENLQATRERILEFLDRAKTVEDALSVNEELTKVEGQIEELQGRINYLSDRAAFSTLTITIEPDLPELVPTPTSTPQPTRTPVPWDPSKTYDQSKKALTYAYQGILNVLIWIGVVILPVIGLPGVIIWLVIRYIQKKSAEKGPADQNDA